MGIKNLLVDSLVGLTGWLDLIVGICYYMYVNIFAEDLLFLSNIFFPFILSAPLYCQHLQGFTCMYGMM